MHVPCGWQADSIVDAGHREGLRSQVHHQGAGEPDAKCGAHGALLHHGRPKAHAGQEQVHELRHFSAVHCVGHDQEHVGGLRARGVGTPWRTPHRHQRLNPANHALFATGSHGPRAPAIVHAAS